MRFDGCREAIKAPREKVGESLYQRGDGAFLPRTERSTTTPHTARFDEGKHPLAAARDWLADQLADEPDGTRRTAMWTVWFGLGVLIAMFVAGCVVMTPHAGIIALPFLF